MRDDLTTLAAVAALAIFAVAPRFLAPPPVATMLLIAIIAFVIGYGAGAAWQRRRVWRRARACASGVPRTPSGVALRAPRAAQAVRREHAS